MRIDKLLFFLRFAKSRTLAQNWAETGHIRVNGRRVEKGSLPIAIGDVITLPIGDAVVSFKLLSMPIRRGPANEVKLCYQLMA
ncbi:MAG: RNA-binding S4 domain-containing protein [Sphingorhabdus sp.]|uniref:RNA-binding S4 domain-containing protein n=1 Tax=Sphingorhabdus sp. TaxID=1902408 RepID=UPI0025EE9E8C|nr:S4 domain-containing protein [Sphingorhabdus sp.]MCO4091601.1 RNA-binding S4 domain-containing protein [Sphingorhabdus sp.]